MGNVPSCSEDLSESPVSFAEPRNCRCWRSSACKKQEVAGMENESDDIVIRYSAGNVKDDWIPQGKKRSESDNEEQHLA